MVGGIQSLRIGDLVHLFTKQEKEVSVAYLMVMVGDLVHWNVSFTRVAQDCEVGSFADFFQLLYPLRPST